MKQLSMMTAGTVFIALGTFGTVPANAALLDFTFTTSSGGTGFFTLNTDAVPDPNPALLLADLEEGIAYTGAISNFSVSSPNVNLSNAIGDYAVFPSLDFSDFLGLPEIPSDTRLYSAAYFPTGCITATDSTCPVGLTIAYTGNELALPALSDNPRSYSTVFDIARFDPQTGEFLDNDVIVRFQPVPESSSVPSILTVAIGGASLLLKRKMNKKKAVIKF